MILRKKIYCKRTKNEWTSCHNKIVWLSFVLMQDFLTTFDVGQYFMTEDTEEFSQFTEPATCREYTLPRDEKSPDPKGWIRGSTKIGPVLEVTTSNLHGKQVGHRLDRQRVRRQRAGDLWDEVGRIGTENKCTCFWESIKGESKTTKTYFCLLIYKNCTYRSKILDWYWAKNLFAYRLLSVKTTEYSSSSWSSTSRRRWSDWWCRIPEYGRPTRSSWVRSVWSSFGRTIMGKAIWESPIETWMGENSKLGMYDSGSYAVFTEQGSSASQMTAAKVMDIISRLPGCDGPAADAVSALTQVKMEDAHKLFKNSQIGMSRHLDSSTTTQMAKIMVQYGRSSRFSWTKSVWSSFGRIVMGKAIWKIPIETWLGKIPNWECLFVHREKGLFLSVYVDDIKLAGKKQNIHPMWKVLDKQVDLGEPTSFLDHENLGCTQRQCETSKDIVDNYRTMFESRISAGATKNYHTRKICVSLHGIMTWKVMSRNVWNDIVSWQTRRLNNSTKHQLHALITIISQRKNRNPWEDCQKYAHKLFWNAYTWHVLEDLIFCEQTCSCGNEMDKSLCQTFGTFDLLHSSHKWIQTKMWDAQHNNADKDVQETNLSFTQFYGSWNNLCRCRFTHGWDSRSRSLGFSDWSISFLTKPNQQNQRYKRATGNLSAILQSNMRKQIPTPNTNPDLTNMDHANINSQTYWPKVISHVTNGTIFNISLFSSTCCAKNSSLRSCPNTMAKWMQEQKRRRKKCGKIEIYSDELVFSCPDKFLIQEKSECIPKSGDTHSSGNPKAWWEETLNPTQRRVLKRDWKIHSHRENLSQQKRNQECGSSRIWIWEWRRCDRETGCFKTAAGKPYASSKSDCQGRPKAEKIEWSHNLHVSPATNHQTEAVFSIVRGTYGREHDDPMNDLDVNMAIWCILLNATLRAAVHLGQDYDVNSLFVKNHLWNSVGQLLRETAKLISDQNEITGV